MIPTIPTLFSPTAVAVAPPQDSVKPYPFYNYKDYKSTKNYRITF